MKVEKENLENLLEMLMNLLVKLDAIIGDGDIKLKKKMQVLVTMDLGIELLGLKKN